jgi:hypothetical protein
MPDFQRSTLWRVSDFERQRDALAAGDGPTILSTTLLADLRHLKSDPESDDVLEVVAACVRHREPALVYLACGAHVWPLTLFPAQQLYHAPRDPLARLKLLDIRRPGVRPPGHLMHERVAAEDKYFAIHPLLWALSLYGPRASLLGEIGGRAAYRLAPGLSGERYTPPGALAPAVTRLRKDAASLRVMAGWPGLSVERASRLLNALYLTDALMVTRTHPSARTQPLNWRALLGRRR